MCPRLSLRLSELELLRYAALRQTCQGSEIAIGAARKERKERKEEVPVPSERLEVSVPNERKRKGLGNVRGIERKEGERKPKRKRKRHRKCRWVFKLLSQPQIAKEKIEGKELCHDRKRWEQQGKKSS